MEAESPAAMSVGASGRLTDTGAKTPGRQKGRFLLSGGLIFNYHGRKQNGAVASFPPHAN